MIANPPAVAGQSKSAAALYYAAGLGWRVFPLHSARRSPEGEFLGCTCGKPHCESPGKHPRTAGGVKDATAGSAVVRAWWARWPDANIGVACGPESGVFMVGPDGEAGRAAFEELCRAGGTSAEGVSSCRASTQSGGSHHLFAWPADPAGLGNYRNHRGLPIDTRAAGGYFVAAPSGGAQGDYAWEAPPGGGPLRPAPDRLLDWCRKPAPEPRTPRESPAANSDDAAVVARARKWLARVPGAVAGQNGPGKTFEAARGVVWGFGLGEEAALELMMAEYNPRCDPPWAERDMLHKVREADTKPFDKPRGYLRDKARPAGPGAGFGQALPSPLKWETSERAASCPEASAGSAAPVVALGADEHRVNAEAEAALASGGDLYQRGGRLVQVCAQAAG